MMRQGVARGLHKLRETFEANHQQLLEQYERRPSLAVLASARASRFCMVNGMHAGFCASCLREWETSRTQHGSRLLSALRWQLLIPRARPSQVPQIQEVFRRPCVCGGIIEHIGVVLVMVLVMVMEMLLAMKPVIV